MTEVDTANRTAEERARVEIDLLLAGAGWAVQDAKRVNLSAKRGVALREVVLTPPHGRVDYLLFVDGEACGVVEAKPEGTTLIGVEWQSGRYADGLPQEIPAALDGGLPFLYESTGVETRFTNALDPDAASRPVFSFHRPETLATWLEEIRRHPTAPTLRHRLRELPPLTEQGLWPAQFRAISNLERSLAENRPRALIQMATGSGKTFTAANVAYRLVKHADAKRILFLVDRANLGRQTLSELQRFSTPDDGRKLTELYNVQRLTSRQIDLPSRVVISTIQRLYAALRGEELDEELDEHSAAELVAEPVPIAYSEAIPPETFDVVIVDECHRSIYGVWRQVLDYFDAFTIGLTATPNKQAFGFFDQNLVMEYGHAEAVVDRVNVDFDVYRIRTEITERGGTIDAGIVTRFRDRQTRRTRWETLDDDLTYTSKELDRAVVARDQIRTVLETFRDRLPTEIFPGRSEVPKTLIFAKDDAHAEEIVALAREVFAKGNEFAAKITYRASGKIDDLIQSFRTSYNPRIAVTVDMIATGTDVKPVECVMFMRSVRSRTYFEQMKGRGVRVISDADLRSVTPGNVSKERFVLVDAVGVTETELVDTVPLDRAPTVPLEKLLRRVSFGIRDADEASAIAARLARLDRGLSESERTRLAGLAGGRDVHAIASDIVAALDPDRQLEAARADAAGPEPTVDEIAAAGRALLDVALAPLATSPELREAILDARRLQEQAIDEVSRDVVLEGTGYSKDAADLARSTVESWRRFCEEHRDEIAALGVLYARRQPQRVTFREVKELAQAIERPPHRWTPEALWDAYERLDASRVRGSGHRVLTDLVSLVRVAVDPAEELVAYPELVRERYRAWLLAQENAGRVFTPEQTAWLERISDHVAASLSISADDLSEVGFRERGGLGKAVELFGDDLAPLLAELNEALVA